MHEKEIGWEGSDTILAIFQLRPNAEGAKRFVHNETIWDEPLYFHERVMVSSWLAILERYSMGNLTKNDLKNYQQILQWIQGLDRKQIVQEGTPNRKRSPFLMTEFAQEVISNQIRSVDLLSGEDWDTQLLRYARTLISALSPIFKGGSLLDVENDILRSGRNPRSSSN